MCGAVRNYVPSCPVSNVKYGCGRYEMDIIKIISQCPTDEVVRA
jgi:hypothetical protein